VEVVDLSLPLLEAAAHAFPSQPNTIQEPVVETLVTQLSVIIMQQVEAADDAEM